MVKKEKETEKEKKEEINSYESRLAFVNEISEPLASKKLNKKVLKILKKADKTKSLKKGVKEVVKALRKNEKGFVVLAGDIYPIDVISHIPVLCEESSIPYIFIPSKEDLGQAIMMKRPTSCVMITPGSIKESSSNIQEYSEMYDDVVSEIKVMNAKTQCA